MLKKISVPHQPRLDWQMWFAALGNYNHNPWLISLSYRLLSGQPEVMALLHPESPWQDKPPKYIRGMKYTYHYSTPEERFVLFFLRVFKKLSSFLLEN